MRISGKGIVTRTSNLERGSSVFQMPSVCLRAVFTSAMPAKWPRVESISLPMTVARLSVITTESSRTPAALPSREAAAINTQLRMPTAGEVTGNHGDNGLVKATAEIIALENERRTALGCAQIGIGKKNQYDVTAPGLHRRWPLQVDPNLGRMSSIGRGDHWPGSR
jgi:hypothetical protein